MTEPARPIDWQKWHDFEGYGLPFADTWAERMRWLVLYLSGQESEIASLDKRLAEQTNARERKYHSHRATLEGSEAGKKAACENEVIDEDCSIRLLEAELRAAKAIKSLIERGWETERSHGSGAKEESRHTDSSN